MHSLTCHIAGRQEEEHINLTEVELQDIKRPGPCQQPGVLSSYQNSDQVWNAALHSTHFIKNADNSFKNFLKNIDNYRLQGPSPTLESQSGQPSIQTDPAVCKSTSLYCGASKVEKKMEVTGSYGTKKGQMSREIINSTWATSAPAQWKGPRTNPRKGHWDLGSQAEKGNGEGLPAAIGVNVFLITHQKGRGLG